MSMITATAWVPRGYAAGFPSRHEFDQDELDRISRLAKLNIDDARADLDEAQADTKAAAKKRGKKDVNSSASNGDSRALADDDDLKEYDLEHYDDEPEDENQEGDDDAEGGSSTIFGNIKALAYHQTNDEDPYITLKDGGGADSDDEDREDLQILPTDNLLLSTRIEDEMAQLEVHVYEDDAANLYVHHDIMLPAVPLCVEWLDYPVGKEGVDPSSHANFVAVGTMDPDIELWDLDTMDSMFPNAILGAGGSGEEARSSGKKKKKKSKQPRADRHVDAVLALAANRQHRNLLASASADTTVKLWDLTKQACAQSYTHHADKVCSLAWHPREATAMLTGSYDRTAAAADMRAPEAGVRTWAVDADVESVRWDPHDENYFYVSTEGGMLYYFDARAAAPPVWRLHAHEKAVTGFAACAHVPGLLATGSDDRSVKLWDARGAAAGGPSLVVTKELDVGRVFSVDFAPDAAVGLRLAAAGSKGALRVWDTGSNKAVRGAFGDRISRPAEGGGVSLSHADEKEQIVGVDGGANNSDSDSDSEDDEGGDEEAAGDRDEQDSDEEMDAA